MITILFAFILGGCLCALFQVIGNYTKAAPPKILLLGIAAGAFLSALGVTSALGAFGGAGIGIMVIGFGEAVFMSVQAALMGNWMPALTTVGVVLALSILGSISGAIRHARTKGTASADPASETTAPAEQF